MPHLLLLLQLLLLISNLGRLLEASTRLSVLKRVPLEVINTLLQRVGTRVCGSPSIVMMMISFERADMYELPAGGRGTRCQSCHVVRGKYPDLLLPFIAALALASTCFLVLLLRPKLLLLLGKSIRIARLLGNRRAIITSCCLQWSIEGT